MKVDIDKLKSQFEKYSDKETQDILEKRQNKIKNQIYKEHKDNTLNGVYIYNKFCEWIKRYRQGRGYKDTEVFKKYMKEEAITLTDRQRLFLATKYFNWQEK